MKDILNSFLGVFLGGLLVYGIFGGSAGQVLGGAEGVNYCGPVYAATAAGTSSLTIHRMRSNSEVSTSTSAAITTATSSVLVYGDCVELDIVNDGGKPVYIGGLPSLTSETGIRLNANGGSKHWGK